MYVCICRALGESDLRRAAEQGITAPEGLIKAFGLDKPDCCGRCAAGIERLAAWLQANAC